MGFASLYPPYALFRRLEIDYPFELGGLHNR